MKKTSLLVALFGLTFFTVKGEEMTQNDDDNVIYDFDPDWNYEKGGDDWNFLNCNNTKQQQSPVDLKNPGIDWWFPDKAIPFTFLPSYAASVPLAVLDLNYTKTALGTFGSIIITEASDYSVTQVIKWDAFEIKFHYPSEHTIAGKSFDMEMQIYHAVILLPFYFCLGRIRDPCRLRLRHWCSQPFL